MIGKGEKILETALTNISGISNFFLTLSHHFKKKKFDKTVVDVRKLPSTADTDNASLKKLN